MLFYAYCFVLAIWCHFSHSLNFTNVICVICVTPVAFPAKRRILIPPLFHGCKNMVVLIYNLLIIHFKVVRL